MPDEGTTNIQCEYPGCLAAAVGALTCGVPDQPPRHIGWYCVAHGAFVQAVMRDTLEQGKREREAHP